MDIAKALLDQNYHAPTTYFPLLVPECLLIEPTETESKETLDNFVAAMIDIARAREDGSRVQGSAVHDAGAPPRRRQGRATAGSALRPGIGITYAKCDLCSRLGAVILLK